MSENDKLRLSGVCPKTHRDVAACLCEQCVAFKNDPDRAFRDAGAAISKAMTAQQVIEDREKAHGSYFHQAGLAQALKKQMRDAGWSSLSVEQRESLDMIAVKISRILNGNPNEPDHWLDLAGYATLVHNILTKGNHLGTASNTE